MNDLDVMRLHANVLFVCDGRGRMIRSNEPDGQTAPDIFLGTTRDDCIVRFGERARDDRVDEVAELIRQGRTLGSAGAERIRAALSRHGLVAQDAGGRVYAFPSPIAPGEAVIQISEDNAELTRHTYPWLEAELHQWWPCFAVVRDGEAVAVCFSSRMGDEACEAGVHTRPLYRGRGYAAAVTAAWARSVVSSGRTPIYSTSQQNIASQGVARRLRLRHVGDDATWRFTSSA